jgi:hypothetical protein
MTEILRTVRDHLWSSSLFFFFTLFTWTAAFVVPWELSFHNLLVFFSPPT